MQINIEQDVSLAFIVAILGIAFPIIIQTIGQIDTKYGSTRLVARIKRSGQYHFFIIMLMCAVLSRIYYCFEFAPLGWFNRDCFIIDNSAFILVYIFMSLLIISLFLFIRFVLKYYDPAKLLEDISKKMMEKEEDLRKVKYKKEIDFKDWTDLSNSIILLSYNKINIEAIQLVYKSFTGYIGKFKVHKDYKKLEYPSYIYISLRSVNKNICDGDNRMFRDNGFVTIFLNGNSSVRISNASYRHMWFCLQEQIEYDRTDLIVNYWRIAYQHYSFDLKYLSEGEEIDDYKITKVDVDNREKDRDYFRLFHYVLGSLFFYKKKYKLLDNLFKYTNSTFQTINLLPDSYSEIMQYFLKIQKKRYKEPLFFEINFPFTDFQEITANGKIIYLIEQYLAVLIIRVEHLEIYGYSYVSRLEMPNMPDVVSEIKVQIEKLERFKNIILEVSKSGVPQKINTKYSNNPQIISKLCGYIENLKEEKIRILKEQKVDDIVKNEFYDKIEKYFEDVKQKFDVLCKLQDDNIQKDERVDIRDSFYRYEDKKLFDSQESSNNMGDVDSSMVSYNIENRFGYELLKLTKKSISCTKDNISKVIEKLKIDENYIIISNRIVSPYFLKNVEKVGEIDNFQYDYKGIKIFDFIKLQRDPLILVLKKEDVFSMGLPSESQENNYSKDMKIRDGGGLFMNVIDLHKEKNEQFKSKEFDNKVLIWVESNITLKYKKDIEILRINIFDESKTKIEDVKSFKEYYPVNS